MEYFPHLKARLAFPTMQEHCAARQLPSSVGWDKLQVKLEEQSRAGPVRAAEIANGLSSIFRETLSIGTRAVRLHRLDPNVAPDVVEFFAQLAPEDSAFLPSYPRPLGRDELNAVPAEPFLCEISRSDVDGSVSLILCSKRIVEEKDPRNRNQIGAAAIQQLGWEQYDEFVLIKRHFVQSYEVIRVDATGMVELRVEEHSGVDTGTALNQLLRKANSLLVRRFGLGVQLVGSVNLFPAVRSIYNDATEGIVVELGFTTDTGSSKHEKMRKNGADLRDELFHVGGKEAINGALTPFRVAVRWGQLEGGRQEEALLPGSIRQLASASPFLDHMVLSGASSELKMRSIVQRVVQHLPAD